MPAEDRSLRGNVIKPAQIGEPENPVDAYLLGGGSVTVQTTEPDYKKGEQWLNPDTGVFYVAYDAGNGGDWYPVPPVTVTEEASTFTESDVSISHSSTIVDSGSISLKNAEPIDDFEDGDLNTLSGWNGWNGDTANLSAQTSTVYEGSYAGEITTSSGATNIVSSTADSGRTTNAEFIAQVATKHADSSDGMRFRTYDGGTAGSIITEIQFRGNDTVYVKDGANWTQIATSWSAGTWYQPVFQFDFGSDEYTVQYQNDTHGPFSLGASATSWDAIEVEDNRSSGSTNAGSVFYELPGASNSGSATISWPAQSDIENWDIVSFQRTLDSESVVINVLDGNGNVLYSDIGQNFDVSTVDSTTDIQIQAEISRSSMSNNPTLDYAARRFTR